MVYSLRLANQNLGALEVMVMGSSIQRILCQFLGIHKWSKWETHPLKGNWVTRQCLFCYKREDRRLF